MFDVGVMVSQFDVYEEAPHRRRHTTHDIFYYFDEQGYSTDIDIHDGCNVFEVRGHACMRCVCTAVIEPGLTTTT